jgi:hypothetical protein
VSPTLYPRLLGPSWYELATPVRRAHLDGPSFRGVGTVRVRYGTTRLEVARVPERGWLLAAVGLAGKLLGPVGLLYLIWSGAWPVATVILCLTNDIVWWIPFGLYLYDSWPGFRREVSHKSFT